MTEDSSRPAGLTPGIVLIGILIVSLNLRPAITSIPPLIEVIRADVGLSYAAVSLLTAIPVLCMGVFAFAVPTVTRVFGREEGVLWAVVVIGVATAARIASANPIVLFGSTILVGIGIAICQTLLPAIVGRYFRHRVAFATGLYAASLSLGAAVATGLTVPLWDLLGSWPLSLTSWTLVAVAGVLVWIPIVRNPPVVDDSSTSDSSTADSPKTGSSTADSPKTGSSTSDSQGQLPLTDPFAWTITILFAGSSMTFYSGLTWLAPRYVALGWSEAAAGILLTLFLITQLVGMFAVSAFGDRRADRRPWFYLMAVLVTVGTAGIALSPTSFPWVWSAVFGTGIGGLFSLALTLPVDFGETGDATDRLSAMAMGIGFGVAAIGPFVIGAIRDLTGGFTSSFIGLTVLGVAMLGLSIQFAPDRAVSS